MRKAKESGAVHRWVGGRACPRSPLGSQTQEKPIVAVVLRAADMRLDGAGALFESMPKRSLRPDPGWQAVFARCLAAYPLFELRPPANR